MKSISRLILPSAACLMLTSCHQFNKPLSSSNASDPLDAPGGTITKTTEDPYATSFTPGTFLQTVSPNTAFFANYPKSSDQPNTVLPDYTDVKVISSKGTYIKVEVVNSGAVGYVPSVMLGEKRAPEVAPVTPPTTPDVLLLPGETPPAEAATMNGTAANPDPVDTPANTPANTPADAFEDLPDIAPEPEIPGNVPPQLIDPSQPAE